MKSVPFVMAILLIASGATLGSDLNGSVEYIGDIRILNLWGTWQEMGYAHGYLLGPEIKSVFEDYFIELAGGVSTYNSARQFVSIYFDIPIEFQEYSSGILAGAADTVDIYSEQLGRNMDQLDIYVVNCTPDVAALKGWKGFACSSVSAWGAATENDSQLQGSPAISRNLDFYVDSAATVLDAAVLITYEPEGCQDFFTLGFAGYMGCVSGMNSSGASATINMGNQQGTTQFTPNFVPICMAMTLGLSDPDFDGSGAFDMEDLKAALTDWNRSNSYAFHLVGDRSLAGGDSCGVVVELANRFGYAFRYSSSEPDIAPQRMILTNHHRELIPPVYCSRYTLLLSRLISNPDIDLDRYWDLMAEVGYPATPALGGTLQTMIFMPEQLRTGVAFATVSEPANQQDPQWIDWADIFPNHSPEGIEEGAAPETPFVVGPNPTLGAITVQFNGSATDLRVFDIGGRLMETHFTSEGDNVFTADLSDLPTGIYRVAGTVIGATRSAQLVLLR